MTGEASTLHEILYLVTLVSSLCLVDQVDLILQYKQVLQLHNLDGSQML